MAIWFNKNLTLSDFSHWNKNTLGEHLGIEFIEIGENYLIAKMPVDHRTDQPSNPPHNHSQSHHMSELGAQNGPRVAPSGRFRPS